MSTTPPFSTLPLELRRLIYRHLLLSPTTIQIRHPYPSVRTPVPRLRLCDADNNNSHVHPPETAIYSPLLPHEPVCPSPQTTDLRPDMTVLRVCRQLHAEATAEMLGCNALHFVSSVDALEFLRAHGPFLRSVRSVSIADWELVSGAAVMGMLGRYAVGLRALALPGSLVMEGTALGRAEVIEGMQDEGSGLEVGVRACEGFVRGRNDALGLKERMTAVEGLFEVLWKGAREWEEFEVFRGCVLTRPFTDFVNGLGRLQTTLRRRYDLLYDEAMLDVGDGLMNKA